MTACERNLPVPTSSRLVKVRSAMLQLVHGATPHAGMTPIGWCGSPAAVWPASQPVSTGSPVLDAAMLRLSLGVSLPQSARSHRNVTLFRPPCHSRHR
jgi:hypothetical protein